MSQLTNSVRPQEEEENLVCEDDMKIKGSADIHVSSFCGQEDDDPEDGDMAHFIFAQN